jgi:hypothetical protein
MRDDACSSIVMTPWLAVKPFTRRSLAEQYALLPGVLTSDAHRFTMMHRRLGRECEMTSANDLAACSWTESADSLPPGESVPPVRGCPRGDAAGGRGLPAVEALPARCGWHPVAWPGLTEAAWAGWIF